MNTERDFLEGKKSAISKLKKAQSENKVDPGILPILDIINESENYYTSSSCFGRIVLLEIPSIGDKKEAKFLGKWHKTINVDELLSAVKNAETGQLWFLSQSPIIHITAKTNNAADKILKTAIASGFKNSGLKSIGKKIVVEVLSTERLDTPVGKDGVLFCNKDHLELLVNISNEIMKKSTLKLQKFEKKLQKDLSNHKTTIE
jgi:tRNA wybutosine-synthesizing protein 3